MPEESKPDYTSPLYERVRSGCTTARDKSAEVGKLFEYTQRAHYEVRACAGVRVGDLGARWDKGCSGGWDEDGLHRVTRYIGLCYIQFTALRR